MKTLIEYFPRGSSVYYGESQNWLVVATRHRDSDLLTESNWECILRDLGGESENVHIERASCSMVGWIEYLIVNPNDKKLVELGEKIEKKLDDYPVYNENHWSEKEFDEYYNYFNDYGKQEFTGSLVKKFNLHDVTRDFLQNHENLIEYFESLIPSGEYQTDGYPNFDYATEQATRDNLAQWVKANRVKTDKL